MEECESPFQLCVFFSLSFLPPQGEGGKLSVISRCEVGKGRVVVSLGWGGVK